MAGLIIWIIIIWIIVVKVLGQSKNTTSNQGSSSKYKTINSHYDDPGVRNQQRSSYYTNQKIDSYRRMNADHENHDGVSDEVDISGSIGYVKCPHCGTLVSKKSKVCFMCDKDLEQK